MLITSIEEELQELRKTLFNQRLNYSFKTMNFLNNIQFIVTKNITFIYPNVMSMLESEDVFYPKIEAISMYFDALAACDK